MELAYTNPRNECRFGAVADDGQDDTAAIQAALDQCARHASKAVCIPAGTFTISLPPKPKHTDLCLAIPSDCATPGSCSCSGVDRY